MLLSLLNFLKQNLNPEINWEIPPKLEFGILTTNYAFVQAKIEKKNPKELAEALCSNINNLFEKYNFPAKAVTIGPYINLDFTDDGWSKFFNLKSKEQETEILRQENKTVLIDYFSPNVGKKMHVGHIRSSNIGETLRRILSLKYEKVISNNHLGDWGIQFGMIIWGLENFEKLDLDFEKPDLELQSNDVSDKLYNIYVKVNSICDEDENVRNNCKKIVKTLETGIINYNSTKIIEDNEFINNFANYQATFFQIIKISLQQYTDAESYLNLNRWHHESRQVLFTEEQINKSYLKKNEYRPQGFSVIKLQRKDSLNQNEISFDTIFGESAYVQFLPEFNYLVEKGLAVREGEAVYVDLEAEKLGRCYLISSEGYSLYHSRDIIARFVWSGLLEADLMLTLADNRQSHSFKQVFAVIKRILDSGIYAENNPNNIENKTFGLLNREETNRALSVLHREMAKHIRFGFMTLPDGAMSTRKGKIVAFEELRQTLEEKVRQTLKSKEAEQTFDEDRVRKIAVASLKWVDLYRDREQDVVFDFDEFLKFEGNTGVYQLYTLARINSILEKNQKMQNQMESKFELLNLDEKLILKQIFTLPFTLENIVKNYKPHHLCNHLFELATSVNSWYTKYSVSTESDLKRKYTLLTFCEIIKKHLQFGLELLGIEPLERL